MKPTIVDIYELRLMQPVRNLPFPPAKHMIQCARLALTAGADEKIVLACLLHDIGFGLMRPDHGWWGAQLVEPYVGEEVAWAIRYHQALRFYPDEAVGYAYPEMYTEMFGKDYRPPDYIESAYRYARSHRWYRYARAITLYDDYSFDKSAEQSMEPFIDILGRHFRQPKEGLGNDNSPVAHMWGRFSTPRSLCSCSDRSAQIVSDGPGHATEEASMDYGVVMFPTEYAIAPDELAKELEARGFESVWFPEHTHIPASRRSPWPGGADLPREYWSAYDPFVALMAAAGVTKKLRLGTGICLLIERDPIVTAKEIATLDRLSGGRVLFGIGAGWNSEEMENHGTAFKTRWRVLRERVLAMKKIWTEKEATFHGEFVNFDRIWADPKPAQKPHPPVIMGGDGATTFDRVVEYGDGWIPILRGNKNPVDRIPELHERLKRAGRDPRSAPVSLFFAPPKREALEGIAAAGVSRAIFGLASEPRDKMLPRLDAYATLIG